MTTRESAPPAPYSRPAPLSGLIEKAHDDNARLPHPASPDSVHRPRLPHPDGWFAIALSEDVPPGKIRPPITLNHR
ncbi:hypothetical protein [Streptomyces sp. NPDC051662]|uniref:hypothetical protein n=1 Tax=Streptomyces sp. NPDC051662 TaxID=3154750 RepID=UPI00343125A3